MRKLATLSALLFFTASLFAQILTPVKWSFASKQINDKEVDLVFTATIDPGWTVYSQFIGEADIRPVPTSFNFDAGSHYSLSGKAKETSAHRKELNDPLFDDLKVIKFSEKVTFTQRLKVSDFSKPVTGYLTYMTCDDKRCLPPSDVDFSFTLEAPKAAEKTEPLKEKDAATSGVTDAAPADIPAGTPSATIASPLAAPPTSQIYSPAKWNRLRQKTG